MANDVSYFKVPGDSTTYSFNDADAENKIGTLETTVASQGDSISTNATNIQTNKTAIGTLSSLTTDAKGNLVAAVNEVDSHADTNASAISTINTAIGSTALPTTAQTITGAIAEHETDITSLNSKINGLTLTRTSTPAGTTKTITTSADSSYLIITTGASANTEHTLSTVLQGASTNNPIVCNIQTGSNVSVTASAAHTLTVTNNATSHTVYIAILTLRGSAPTVA